MPSMPGITMSVITSCGVRSRHIAESLGAISGLQHLMAGAGQCLRDQPPIARIVVYHDNIGHLSSVPVRAGDTCRASVSLNEPGSVCAAAAGPPFSIAGLERFPIRLRNRRC